MKQVYFGRDGLRTMRVYELQDGQRVVDVREIQLDTTPFEGGFHVDRRVYLTPHEEQLLLQRFHRLQVASSAA